jgi:hypothetical protein
VAVAIHLLANYFSRETDAIAYSFWFVACTLIGAGALCPFRRGFSGGLIGFIVAIYLLIEPANTDPEKACESWKAVVEEITASHAELDEHSSKASATASQPVASY